MKSLLTALVSLLVAASLLADEPIRRTIVVKDGKVITNGDVFALDGRLLGGKRPYLGVQLIDLTSELRHHFGTPKDAGILVGSVEDGSPAEKAGLRAGDIVLSIDGVAVDSSGAVRRAMQAKKDGESVRVEVLRAGARQTVVAAVVEKESRLFGPIDIEEMLTTRLGTRLDGPEWRARVETLGDCGSLQSRIKELETRLKDLEKKLQK